MSVSAHSMSYTCRLRALIPLKHEFSASRTGLPVMEIEADTLLLHFPDISCCRLD